jgi:hypothetical protein
LVVGRLVASPTVVAADPTSAELAGAECDGQLATLVGADGDDVLVGTAGPM